MQDPYRMSYRAWIQEDHLPSVIQKSWGLAADADADAGVHFDAAPYLQHQQIVDQKLVTHAKGVQDGHVCHLLWNCFHLYCELLLSVHLFPHLTHHHNHNPQLMVAILLPLPQLLQSLVSSIMLVLEAGSPLVFLLAVYVSEGSWHILHPQPWLGNASKWGWAPTWAY